MLRFASSVDAQALLEIYAPYVTDTLISFEFTVPTVTEFQDRIEMISRQYPFLVYEKAGEILGYAYAHRHMERAAYQWNAETSIYLRSDAKGCGRGRLLYNAVLNILHLQGICTAYACITGSNEESLFFHRAMGFTETAVFRNAGYKSGHWHDIVWMEKDVSSHDEVPKPLIPVSALNHEAVMQLL